MAALLIGIVALGGCSSREMRVSSDITIDHPAFAATIAGITGREFAVGDDYVSAPEAGEEGLVRRDYDPEHFDEGRDDVFAFWRYRVQADEDANKPRPLDVNFLADFFRRLQSNPTAGPREVAYIVALLLVRKTVLLLEGSEPIEPAPLEEGAEPDPLAPKENLLVRFAKEEDATTLKVAVPELSEDKMDAIRDDLGRIFNLGDSPKKKKEAPAAEAAAPVYEDEAPKSGEGVPAAESGAEEGRAEVPAEDEASPAEETNSAD